MFESLTRRFEAIFRGLRSRGRLSEADVAGALREVRVALLEADVHFRVAKRFVERLKERLVGEELSQTLNPGQQVVKEVHRTLVELLGGAHVPLTRSEAEGPTLTLLVGLQGSGKTTTAAKLAVRALGQGRRPLLASADPRRPAAAEQLRQLGRQVGAAVFESGGKEDPIAIGREAAEEARRGGYCECIVDTAGRLHVDRTLMEEIRQMRRELGPQEVLLVADALTGQDAVNLGRAFHEAVGLTGVVLTKLDGDARGGAALSLREVTGVPIKLVGVGERLDALEEFHPERMAGRILGMGDVLGLIERAEKSLEAEKAQALAEKLSRDRFTLEDFREQLWQLRRMGPLEQLLELVPGLRRLSPAPLDERELVRVEAIINSMTPGERREPSLINGSRRRRIARGSGTSPQEVNRLLRQFAEMRKMVRQVSRGGLRGRGGMWKGMSPS
ncbi:MAG: signal recognition particle protein [Nitrospinota bacterium]